MDFENKTGYHGWRLGRGAADMLTTELVKSGKLDMFEREQLDNVLKEQNLGSSGRIDPTTAARIGKLLGVKYIITGAVTEYGRSKSGGGGPDIKVGKTTYQATVDVRLVDTTSGRIVFADTGSGTKSGLRVKVFGWGGGEKANEKSSKEVMRLAIKDVARKMETVNLSNSTSSRVSRTSTNGSDAKALVADVDGNIITLNKGADVGFKQGQTVTIKRQGKVIKDPATGKVLKVKFKTVGTVKLTTVEGSYSEGETISGSGFKVGDGVR
jgi:curli biogenesis system outer membrane secretion channel CsgG